MNSVMRRAAIILAMILAAAPADAIVLTYAGIVDEVNAEVSGFEGLVAIGDRVEIMVELDTSVPDSIPMIADAGRYTGALLSASAAFAGGPSFSYGTGDVSTSNGVSDVINFLPTPSGVDPVFGLSPIDVSLGFFEVGSAGSPAGMLDSDALPTTPFSFEDFGALIVGFSNGEQFWIEFNPVPEPHASMLIGLAILSVAAWRAGSGRAPAG